ncbi:MAG: DUF4386 domain-containing protein [Alphaproteobacteria bacterium]|nr:DUF4386 domain-containing protein [Alphaproteobacteria bacterium]MBV9063412.1 DUF4386 domain-containing protein [Alphaproteobacteria bacterium]
MGAVPTRSERLAARLAGAAYLIALPLSFFSEFYVLGAVIDPNSMSETAHRLQEHQQLFRLGTASNFLVFVADGVLIASLYWVLRRVNPFAALLALVWRVLETALLFAALVFDAQAARLMGGSSYLSGQSPTQLALLARLAISGHGAAYNFALVLAGLSSTVFALLWWRSGYIPKWLAGFGVVASILLALGTFIAIPFPAARSVITSDVYGDPIGIFELVLGLWLLFIGLPKDSARARPAV